MKVDSNTFKTIGGTTSNDLRLISYEFLKFRQKLSSVPRIPRIPCLRDPSSVTWGIRGSDTELQKCTFWPDEKV